LHVSRLSIAIAVPLLRSVPILRRGAAGILPDAILLHQAIPILLLDSIPAPGLVLALLTDAVLPPSAVLLHRTSALPDAILLHGARLGGRAEPRAAGGSAAARPAAALRQPRARRQHQSERRGGEKFRHNHLRAL